jgi:hypothetical protein
VQQQKAQGQVAAAPAAAAAIMELQQRGYNNSHTRVQHSREPLCSCTRQQCWLESTSSITEAAALVQQHEPDMMQQL